MLNSMMSDNPNCFDFGNEHTRDIMTTAGGAYPGKVTQSMSHISNNVLSSTYLYNETVVLYLCMLTRKHLGPDRIPCCTHSGMTRMGIRIFYFLLVSYINVAIHLTLYEGKTYICRFLLTNDD